MGRSVNPFGNVVFVKKRGRGWKDEQEEEEHLGWFS